MTSAADLARRFEGLRLKAYLCPAGIWTVGYGATGPDVYEGLVVTREWAEDRLKRDLARSRSAAVRYCPKLDGNALEAITDFVFNLGAGRLAASTLRRRINAEDWTGARVELAKWVWGGGRKLPGLVLRRAAEAELLPI